MVGTLQVETKKGVVFEANLWEVICLLAYRKQYLLMSDIVKLSVDGQPIPKPESMEDET